MVRVIKWEGTSLVNICDPELLGRTVEGDGVTMNISEDYFSGESMGEESVVQLVRSCSMANLVGNRIVNIVLRENLASQQAVRSVGGVSFLMIFKFGR